MLTLFPRPKPLPPKPLDPEPQNDAPVPLESAPESAVVEPPVEEIAPEPIAIDQAPADVAISIDESLVIEESAAVEESVAPDALNLEEESIAAELSSVEAAAPEASAEDATVAGVDVPDAMEPEVVHTITFDIAAIVEEISTRIHAPKPVASEMAPSEPRPTEKVSAEMAEDDSELIEWDDIDLSSPEASVIVPAVEETPIFVEAATESHVPELSAEDSFVTEEVGEPADLNAQDPVLHATSSVEPSVSSVSSDPTALEAVAEQPTEEALAAEADATEVTRLLSPSEVDYLIETLVAGDVPQDSSATDADIPLGADETAAPIESPALMESPAFVESADSASDARDDRASSESGLLDLPRVAEPEVMDDAEEVEAYASAAAQEWLNAIDATFIEHAARLVKERQRGRALDIGTGPGQITLKLALRLSLWKFIGVDRSQKMIDQALSHLAATAPATGRLEFHIADGNRLDYPNASFDLVVCNSVLHHFAEPQNLLAEMARVVKPRGAILLRDLRRPSRLKYPFHVRWHGRRYTGTMNKLYRDSVRAAYTVPELQLLLAASPLRGARVFKHGSTHIGIERPYNW